MKSYSLILLALFIFPLIVQAKQTSGCFKALDSCEAYQSYRKKTNPGAVRLDVGKTYKIIEKSSKLSAYRIQIKGIKRSARWVKGSCGEMRPQCNGKPEISLSKKKSRKFRPFKKAPEYLLALSWQPTFCESHSRKKECRTQTSNRYDANHWSLHGLWPQPRGNAYCGVNDIDKGIDRNKRWHLLEPLKLSQKTAIALAFVMPGMSSNLHRHEWIKHGSCYGTDANSYYSDAINLTLEINESIVGKLFTRGVGKRVSLKQLRKHFDKAFGKGSGKKVDMRCDRKGRVSEIWINLKGRYKKEGGISALLTNSLNAGSSCQIGVVDKAG